VTTDSPPDNRRAIVRIFAHDILRAMNSLARLSGGDTIEFLTFTGVWVLNSHHLIGEERFAELRDIPPNALRRPVSFEELQRLVCIPEDILSIYVDRLIEKDIVERSAGGGLVVPTAVFAQPAMLDGTNEIYSRAVALVTSMRAAGFQFGDEAELDLKGPASS
jgi:hypothetical protein